VASADVTVSSGADQTVTIPMAAVLQPGQDYRIGFFIEAGGSGGSADLVSAEGYPYWEDQGLFRMNGGYSIGADAFPANVNAYVPLTELEVAREWTEGDANLDGCVDGLDYNNWSLHYLGSGGWRGGDFNFDGIADGMDYNLWSLHYGHGWRESAAIPEPGCAALLLLGVVALGRPRRRAPREGPGAPRRAGPPC